jgi:hypothetical protein
LPANRALIFSSRFMPSFSFSSSIFSDYEGDDDVEEDSLNQFRFLRL